MPFTLTCPNPSCAAEMNTRPIPLGREVHCPKCKEGFTVDSTNLVEIDTDATATSFSVSSDLKGPIENGDARGVTDDGFRKPAAKKGGNKVKITVMVSSAILLTVGFICLLIYLSKSNGGSDDKKMMAYIPANANLMFGANVDEMVENEDLREQHALKILNNCGIEFKNISKVYSGIAPLIASPDRNYILPTAYVIRFKKKPDNKKIAEAMKGTEEKHKDITYYKGSQNFCFFPAHDLAVLTNSEELLKKLMEKDNNDVVISDDLKSLVDAAGGATIWYAADAGKGKYLSQANFVARMAAGQGTNISGAFKTANGVAVWAKVGSENGKADVGMALLCKDSETASKAIDEIKNKLDKARQEIIIENVKSDREIFANDAVGTLRIESSGRMLKGSASVHLKPLLKEWMKTEAVFP